MGAFNVSLINSTFYVSFELVVLFILQPGFQAQKPTSILIDRNSLVQLLMSTYDWTMLYPTLIYLVFVVSFFINAVQFLFRVTVQKFSLRWLISDSCPFTLTGVG